MTINRPDSPRTKTSNGNYRSATILNYLSNLKTTFFRKPTLKSIFSHEYPNEANSTKDAAITDQNQELVHIDLNEPLPNDFVSEKRKSIIANNSSSQNDVPRSSNVDDFNIPGKNRSYSTISFNYKAAEDSIDRSQPLSNNINDSVPNKSLLAIQDDWNFSSKDNTPLNNDILIANSRLNLNDDLENQSNFYYNEEGNVVRPPFINLDPKERHQLLQLKRSIEASESLQKRIKYMVNPNETTSENIFGTNKVNLSTQTHDTDLLSSHLQIRRKRRKDSVHNASNAKRQKSRGFFCKDYLYDVDKATQPAFESSTSSHYKEFNKPVFNKNTTADKSKHFLTPHGFDDLTKKFGKSKHRDISFGTQNSNIQLDSEYLKKSESVASYIKLKDQVKTDVSTVNPSNGFKFDLDQNKFDELKKESKLHKDLTSTLANAKSTDLFGKSEVSTTQDKKTSFALESNVAGLQRESSAVDENKAQEHNEKNNEKTLSSGQFQTESGNNLFQETKSTTFPTLGIKAGNNEKFQFSNSSTTKDTKKFEPQEKSVVEPTDEENIFVKKRKPDFESKVSFEPASINKKPDESSEKPKNDFSLNIPQNLPDKDKNEPRSTSQNSNDNKSPSTNRSNSFKFAAGITPPPSTSAAPSFSFGGPSQPNPTNIFNKPLSINSTTSNMFGNTSTSKPDNSFNNPQNSFNKSDTKIQNDNKFGGSSRPTTPVSSFNFNFGGSDNAGPGITNTKQTSFNFTGSKETTPDPASIFGQHHIPSNVGSRESTPFSTNTIGFGQNQQQIQPQQLQSSQPQPFGLGQNFSGSNPAIPNNSFGFGGANPNPPVPNPRRILQPRSRRR